MQCKVCDKGQLESKKMYRLSGPAVVVGYIILVPCVIGMLIGLFTVATSVGGSAEAVSSSKEIMAKEFVDENENLPTNIKEKILKDDFISEKDKENLTDEQKDLIASFELNKTAVVGSAIVVGGLGSGVGIFFIISSFVGGIVGWILTMKKKVLQCLNCNAVVNAS